MKKSRYFMMIAAQVLVFQACIDDESFIAHQENTPAMADTGQGVPVASTADVHTRYVFPIVPVGDFGLELVAMGPGSLSVDWGDGQVQQFDFQDTNTLRFLTLSHDYADEAFPISITGDLDRIIRIDQEYYSPSMMEGINTFHLTELKRLAIYRFQTKILDLTNNEHLQFLAMSDFQIGQLKLPKSHDINFVEVGFDPSEKVQINRFVENIYNNAVAKNITGGTFNLGGGTALSDENRQNLQTLRDVYHWSVHY